MKMLTRVAFSNAKYYKNKNILIGVAIILTTLLLFLIPTLGKNMIDGQKAAINEFYPTWHVLFRDVDEQLAGKLSAHHSVDKFGLRSDAGYMVASDANISMIYMDINGVDLYNVKLKEGRIPEKENEIVVSEGILKELNQEGGIGDMITVPYQIYRDGGLDLAQEGEFVISGFLEDSETNLESRLYTSIVSEQFLKNEIPKEQIYYRFLFQVSSERDRTTTDIESTINNIAAQFEITENNVRINEEYLWANYIDPAFVPMLVIIMFIVVLAGIITIYSIYYVSMPERIKEFGKLKAIGATKRQIKQIVLREGFLVALFSIPVGLIIGTIISEVVRRLFFTVADQVADHENVMMGIMAQLFLDGKVQKYYWWIYIIAILVTCITVYFSLLKPMNIAGKVSEIEAMRYAAGSSDAGKKKKVWARKGYIDVTIFRLTKIFLGENKKRSFITICSMSATGIFIVVVATVLSCANPVESANNSLMGQYEISANVEFGNKEHPEREWSSIQQNNPLANTLKERVEELEGVNSVVCFSSAYVNADAFGGGREGILGVPKECADLLETGIIEGTAAYEDLQSGDHIIIDRNMLRWYPNLAIGDHLKISVIDGDHTYEKEVTIIAIGEYPSGFTNYSYMIMAKEAVDALTRYDNTSYFRIFADEEYNEGLERDLQELLSENELLEMQTWKNLYEEWKTALVMTSGACYAFLGILALICVMNMINTMIHSVHIRKKEIGMMQAIGMSDNQLTKMLQLEGLFYTIGTLICSLGVGSVLGYMAYLWAKDSGMFNISSYHYPVEAALLIAIVLFVIQMILASLIGKSLKKDSLIDRVRFSE